MSRCEYCGNHGIRNGEYCDCVYGVQAKLTGACPVCDVSQSSDFTYESIIGCLPYPGELPDWNELREQAWRERVKRLVNSMYGIDFELTDADMDELLERSMKRLLQEDG
jgi:hypothetical protein